MKYYVYTPRASRGARALSKALGGKRIKQWQPVQPTDVVINWGTSDCGGSSVLNNGGAVKKAANKLRAFLALRETGVAIPRFATTSDAVSWDGVTVVRHKLTGHSGEGIELVPAGGQLPTAPLFVEYIKKEEEYRVHVGLSTRHAVLPMPSVQGVSGEGTSIIAVQRKARRLDHDNPNWQIRSHDNGFVFVRGGFTPPPAVLHEASGAVVALGLDFGAVDVIWNAQQEKAYVLEVNTAPGLEGQTVEDYRDYFKGNSDS